jgi:hypothetical protein
MSLFRSVVAALVVAAALLPGPARLSAQSGAGTITGIVKDSSGLAVPGAQVNVINEATSVGVESTTDATGSYRVEDLVPGSYRVETALDGFETAVRRIVLAAADGGQRPRDPQFTQSVVVTARRVRLRGTCNSGLGRERRSGLRRGRLP